VSAILEAGAGSSLPRSSGRKNSSGLRIQLRRSARHVRHKRPERRNPGFSDALIAGWRERAQKTLAGWREANPNLAMGGQITGAVGPVILGQPAGLVKAG